MFPPEIWSKPIWCLYDDMAGNIILMHPWRPGISVLCPRCGTHLILERYRATCCGFEFKTGFGAIRQAIPIGTHDRTSGRGWSSLRPAALAAQHQASPSFP